MTLSTLLLGTGAGRPTWAAVGASLIAIDRLVHAFLHRTGILRDQQADHAFGPACYRPGHCADIIDALARRIDARGFNAAFPAYFPRFVQYAIWTYCAAGGLNICNGNKIDDSRRCGNKACALFSECRRVAFRPLEPAPDPMSGPTE